jgi:hypothetical protein
MIHVPDSGLLTRAVRTGAHNGPARGLAAQGATENYWFLL